MFLAVTFKTLASFCGCAGRFEFTLVANPEDRFSCDETHIVLCDFLASKGSPFQNLFIFTAAGVNCRIVTLKFLVRIIYFLDNIFSSPLRFLIIPNIQFR